MDFCLDRGDEFFAIVSGWMQGLPCRNFFAVWVVGGGVVHRFDVVVP